jgi:hypothetical protein
MHLAFLSRNPSGTDQPGLTWQPRPTWRKEVFSILPARIMRETPLLFPFKNSIVHLLLTVPFVWYIPSLEGERTPIQAGRSG